ncbi:recombinase family protein [Halomonas sabkhae]|uniref:recombinase family protein n=1 Tax=Halomonas sabkhae TaxID=626223 RepID=UPI0025B32957|nr:recombinase family protein [Halomonas sabkhae]MDN3525087.1 recombinase family protein [Halomonas sabkhae]
MNKAIAYVRYSSAVQATGDSIERQRSPLEAFESRFQVKIEEIFTDEGVSSFRGDNIKKGKFSEILEKIESEEIKKGDFLVIESIDRISRQALNKTATTLYGILEKGVKIYTTNDERLYSLEDKSKDLENYLMIGLIAKRANEESETKSKRRRSAWNKSKRLAEEGKVFNGSNNTPYGIEVVDGKFRVVEDEAEEIRYIFNNLKYKGVTATIREVNEWSKRKWRNRHVDLMVKNKYPAGYYMAQKRENGKKVFDKYIPNYYPAIISETVYFEAVDAMRKRRNKKEYGNESTGSLNIFRHCVKCGECGSTMIFTRNKNPQGKIYNYLKCAKHKEQKEKCPNHSIRFEYCLAVFISFVEKILQFDDVEGVHFGEVDKIKRLLTERNEAESKKEREEVVESLNKERNVLENLEKSIEGETFIPKIIIKKLQEAEEKVENLESEVKRLEAKQSESLEVKNIDELLRLIYKEDGRLKVNKFFKENGISFTFDSEKDESVKSVVMIVSAEKEQEFGGFPFVGSFKLRNNEILKKYKIEDFGVYS